MTDPEGTPQETELNPGPAIDEAMTVVNQEAAKKGAEEAERKGLTADYQIAGEKAGAADYQARVAEFNNVESPVPVVTLPVKTPSLEKSGDV